MSNITDIITGRRAQEHGLRRHALQLAAQLPEDHQDALQVLRYVWELEMDFLDAGRPSPDSIATPSIFSRSRPPKARELSK